MQERHEIKEPDTMYPTLTGYEIIGWYVNASADSDVADIDSWETGFLYGYGD